MDNKDVVRMANQMASFFKSYGQEEGSRELATHINYFWEPVLREQFLKLIASNETFFDSLVKAAVARVNDPRVKKPNVHVPQDAKTGLPVEATEA